MILKLTLTDTAHRSILINLNNVTHVIEHSSGTLLCFIKGNSIEVAESMEDIEKMINMTNSKHWGVVL